MPAQGDLHEAGVAVAEGYVGCVWGEEGSNGRQAAMCSRRFWAILIRCCDGTVAIWGSVCASGSINERREDGEEVDWTEEHWCEAYSFMTVFRVSSMHLSLP